MSARTLQRPDFQEGSSDVPVWSADGKCVFYAAQVGANVERFQAGLDGRTEQLTKPPQGTQHYHPQLSPDGRQIAYHLSFILWQLGRAE